MAAKTEGARGWEELRARFCSNSFAMYVSGKLPTYPSPNLTLTLTSRFGQNVRFGEGWVGSFPETYIDPKIERL